MKEKIKYSKPEVLEYGTVFGLTQGHFKTFGPGDGIVLVDDSGNVIGAIGDAPSSFH